MKAPSGTRVPLADRLLALALNSSAWFEELVVKVDRRLVGRAFIPVVGLFLLVGIVGSWHGKLRSSTMATDAVWTVVVTTYKVSLVAFVLLLAAAFMGATYRKRQRSQGM